MLTNFYSFVGADDLHKDAYARAVVAALDAGWVPEADVHSEEYDYDDWTTKYVYSAWRHPSYSSQWFLWITKGSVPVMREEQNLSSPVFLDFPD